MLQKLPAVKVFIALFLKLCPTMGPPPALGQSLVTSSSGMPGERRSLGQAPLGICCHAAAGIPKH